MFLRHLGHVGLVSLHSPMHWSQNSWCSQGSTRQLAGRSRQIPQSGSSESASILLSVWPSNVTTSPRDTLHDNFTSWLTARSESGFKKLLAIVSTNSVEPLSVTVGGLSSSALSPSMFTDMMPTPINARHEYNASDKVDRGSSALPKEAEIVCLELFLMAMGTSWAVRAVWSKTSSLIP